VYPRSKSRHVSMYDIKIDGVTDPEGNIAVNQTALWHTINTSAVITDRRRRPGPKKCLKCLCLKAISLAIVAAILINQQCTLAFVTNKHQLPPTP
jgi:hypothetical protein